MRRIMWKFLNADKAYGHCHLFIRRNCPDLNWNMLRDHLGTRDVIVATGNTHLIDHLKLGLTTNFIDQGTVDAFERKDEIKFEIMACIVRENLPADNVLVLACLGPTAGIIAEELIDQSVQVWDTGHIFEFAAEGFIEDHLDCEITRHTPPKNFQCLEKAKRTNKLKDLIYDSKILHYVWVGSKIPERVQSLINHNKKHTPDYIIKVV